MHSETLMYMITQMYYEDLTPPTSRKGVPVAPLLGEDDFVRIKGGKVRLGADYGIYMHYRLITLSRRSSPLYVLFVRRDLSLLAARSGDRTSNLLT